MAESSLDYKVNAFKALLTHVSSLGGNITFEYSGDGINVKLTKTELDSPANEPISCIGFQHPDAGSNETEDIHGNDPKLTKPQKQGRMGQ